MYKDKNILVFGLAKSGYYVTKLLYKDNSVTVLSNVKDEEKMNELKNLGVNVIMGEEIDNLEEYDVIIKNPGIIPTHPILEQAKLHNIPIVNEVEVSYHYLPKCKIIAITGSNGKTTTTTIIYNILSKMFDNVHLGGNIGYPLSQIVPEVKEGDILVLEISDHQLYDVKDFKTDISLLTNLCPTHLDFHGNYENYKNVKKKIFNHHTKSDLAIINAGNQDSMNLTADINSNKVYFDGANSYIKDNAIYVNEERIIDLDDILLKGHHNYENIMAALLVVNEFGIDKEKVFEFLNNFNGVEHRLEFVKNYNNILFYNDSKATNPTSTIIALNSFNKPIHLILGGFERSQDFNELNESMKNVKCIYAVGETTKRVMEYAESQNIPCFECSILENAVQKISESVLENEVVLLSPASASWDQYDKFETRGEEFKKLVAKYFN